MIRSCIRQAVRVFAGAAFFSCALAANAGSITLSDTNCDSFSLTGSPGNQTLTCVVSNAPSGCSIQGPSTGTNGNAITLTAVCATGSPTSYVWTNLSASCTTQSCQTVASNQTLTYGVTPSNNIGPGNTATKQVVWSASLPNKPSGCSITPTPSSLPATGGSVSLTAACSGGDAVDTWNWAGATYTTTSGNTATATISATTTFTVTPTNGGGSSSAQVTVNVGSGGGGGAISCSGFLNTDVLTLVMPFDPNETLAMGPLDIGVVKFTTASVAGTGSIVLSTAGNQASVTHDYTLSDTPCDFTSGRKTFTASGAPTFRVSVTTSGGTGLTLKTGTTYYINVRNNAVSGCTVNGGTCNLFPVSASF